jgi:hypothetical protein
MKLGYCQAKRKLQIEISMGTLFILRTRRENKRGDAIQGRLTLQSAYRKIQ